MCSGCSGYFEGDSEDRELDDQSSLNPEAYDSESPPFLARAAGDWEGYGSLANGPGGCEDDYEVLVGTDRIVERRTIRAKASALSAIGTFTASEIWQKSLREHERSLATNANTYRTHGESRWECNCRSNTHWMCLLLWGLGVGTAVVLALWLTAS